MTKRYYQLRTFPGAGPGIVERAVERETEKTVKLEGLTRYKRRDLVKDRWSEDLETAIRLGVEYLEEQVRWHHQQIQWADEHLAFARAKLEE